MLRLFDRLVRLTRAVSDFKTKLKSKTLTLQCPFLEPFFRLKYPPPSRLKFPTSQTFRAFSDFQTPTQLSPNSEPTRARTAQKA